MTFLDDRDAGYFGIGLVRAMPEQTMVDAAVLCHRMLHHFAANTSLTPTELLAHLASAARYQYTLDDHTLHVFVFAVPPEIGFVPPWRAFFAASTNADGPNQQAFISTFDRVVDDWLARQGWPPDVVTRQHHSKVGRAAVFTRYVFVATSTPAMSTTGAL